MDVEVFWFWGVLKGPIFINSIPRQKWHNPDYNVLSIYILSIILVLSACICTMSKI